MADIIFILIVAIFSYIGARRGIIKTIMGVFSTVLSLLISMSMYRPLSDIISKSPLGTKVYDYMEKVIAENADGIYAAFTQKGAEISSQIIIDAMSFILVILLAKIIISVVSHILNLVSKMPVIHQANSLLGFVGGVVGGIIVCYIAVGIAGVLPAEGISQMLENSFIATLLSENNIIIDLLS